MVSALIIPDRGRGVPGLYRPAIGTLLPKGKTRAIRCFEPVTPEYAGTPAAMAYQQAFAMLEASDPKTRQAFAALVGPYGEDALAMFHLGRLLAGETGTDIDVSLA